MTAHVTSQARSRKVLDVFLTVIGELLLTAGLLIGLFLVWQLWWTSIDANAKARTDHDPDPQHSAHLA